MKKLLLAQLVKKYPAFYRNPKVPPLNHILFSHHNYLLSNLILSFHIFLNLSDVFFFSGHPTQLMYVCLISTMCAVRPIFLGLNPRNYMVLNADESNQPLNHCISKDLLKTSKRSGREAYHSLSSSAQVKNTWSYTSVFRTSSWCVPQSIKHLGNSIFYLNLN
jgi:hypothetical protein